MGLEVTLANGQKALNTTAFNFLGLNNNEQLKAAAVEALSHYGVGTCGPPGFYGTLGTVTPWTQTSHLTQYVCRYTLGN